jgi:hypothetical protein
MLSKKHKELEAQIKADQESAKAKEKALESKATSVQALDTKSVSSETQQKG